MIGNLDTPAQNSILNSSAAVFMGWVFSPLTKQQPSHLQGVYVSSIDGSTLTPNQYAITWRLNRPDVAAAYGVQSPYLGFHLVIHPGVLPVGAATIAVNFTDATGIGLCSLQVNVVVQ